MGKKELAGLLVITMSLKLVIYCRPYTVTFITSEGEKIDVKATEGDTMLDLAQRYDIDLECMC